jgi:hypothetical protein
LNASTANTGSFVKDVHVRFVHATVFVGGWLLVLLGVWMCGRRVLGGIERPLSAAGFFVLAFVVVCLASLLRLGWFWSVPEKIAYRQWKWFGIVVPAVGASLLVASISLPSSPIFGLALCWIVIVCAELLWAIVLLPNPNKTQFWLTFLRGNSHASPDSSREDRVDRDASDVVTEDAVNAMISEEGLSQSLTRKTLADGTEEISGVLCGRFNPKQRSENLHVAFCPPLDEVPTIDFSQLSGAPARIKLGEIQTFGARFELRLSSAHTEESEVVIHFVAQTPSTRRGD